MSTYEDVHGNRLTIAQSTIESLVRVTAATEYGRIVIVTPEKADAPEVSAAFLEEAGVEPIDPAEPGASATPERLALYWLHQWQGLREATAGREAEDAKVRAWRTVALEADGARPGSISEWGLMGESKKDIWRNRYRAAREFFTGSDDGTDYHAAAEQTEPRVLNYGDPEPDRGTRWRDKEGDLWERFDDGWHWTEKGNGKPDSYAHTWSLLQRRYFPMWEVTARG